MQYSQFFVISANVYRMNSLAHPYVPEILRPAQNDITKKNN